MGDLVDDIYTMDAEDETREILNEYSAQVYTYVKLLFTATV